MLKLLARLTLLLVVAGSFSASCQKSSSPTGSEAFQRAMNRGKAFLENKSSAQAIEEFRAAVREEPRSAPALRNLARAELLARDHEAAMATLTRAAELERSSVATSYLTGISLARQSRFVEALPHLEEAVRLDPGNPTLRFQLANALQADAQHQKAEEQLRATVELDPFHTSAHYKLASYARSRGDQAEFETRQRELVRLRKLFGESNRTPEALETCAYTLAEPIPAIPEVSSPLPVEWADSTAAFFPGQDSQQLLAQALAIEVLDVATSGHLELITLVRDGSLYRLSSEAEPFVPRKLLDAFDGLEAADPLAVQLLAGNLLDEPIPDTFWDPSIHPRADLIAMSPQGARLLIGRQDRTFDDRTKGSGIAEIRGENARWVDYDHDGDIDLSVATGAGFQLWQNDGAGHFEEVSELVGLEPGGPASDLAVADLDGDVALDLAIAGGQAPTRLYDNQRTGSFALRPDPPGPWPAASRILLDDFDRDGHPDGALLGDRELTIIPGDASPRQSFEHSIGSPLALESIDFDNDGWLDLVAAGQGSDGTLTLWRNIGTAGTGTAGFVDVSEVTGIGRAALGTGIGTVYDLRAADVDVDGDSDLLVVSDQGLRILENRGGDRNRQLKIRLIGTKTNPLGFGSRIEVRQGSTWWTRTISRLPIEIGLGSQTSSSGETGGELDALLVVWTNGIVDNQVGIQITEQPITIDEKNVASGSCPFLYRWDGDGYRFVTDILGNSPVGLSLRRGVPLDADPDELVMVGSGAELGPDTAGRLRLLVSEEMREVLYLDHAELVAIDHLPEVEVHSTDKLMPAPFPPSEVWPLGQLRKVRQAMGDDGIDRLHDLAAIDGRFAPPGRPLPPPLRGMTVPLRLDLDFGEIDPNHPWVMALTGWLQYGDASTNIAASQNPSLEVVPPKLEAEAGGSWYSLETTVGMPAGKTKTILVDLAGKLRPGTRRFRLVSSFEIRWDRIALGQRLASDSIRAQRLAPTFADLAWRGFAEISSRHPGHPATPDPDNLRPRPPWRTALTGWATRLGEVTELVTSRDQRLALVVAGDALELAFPAAELSPVPPGWQRTFFFYSVGWDKDGDTNVIDGDTIEPFPVTAAGDQEWRTEYNTRWIPRFPYGEKPR